MNAGTGATFKTTTNSVGRLHFSDATGRRYRLTATAPGFKRYEANNVVTQVNEITR